MPLFTTLTAEGICEKITAAKRHVILAAPGISIEVAKALVHANTRLGHGAVQVVLDVSAKVPRLGYGEHAAVEHLTQAGSFPRRRSGSPSATFLVGNANFFGIF